MLVPRYENATTAARSPLAMEHAYLVCADDAHALVADASAQIEIFAMKEIRFVETTDGFEYDTRQQHQRA
jgi:hypothetical protein